MLISGDSSKNALIKKKQSGSAMMFSQSFIAHAGMLDGPMGLFLFNVFRSLLRSYRLIG